MTEGGDASFTLTAAPKPASSLDVSVTVSQSGDFGVSTGVRTVTIPTGGSYTLTVATTDDGVVEVDGSVSVTVGSGTGYTVSSSSAAATVGVSDDDVPEVSIAAGAGVTEGGDASFTLTAAPKPASSLDVSVTVSQSGDFGVSTGVRTVSIPTGGSVSFAVSTTNDAADEVDGSVSVTVGSGAGYTVSTQAGSVSVVVSDDDPTPVVPVVSVVGGGGVTEGTDVSFTVSASPRPSSALSVQVSISQSGDFGVSTGVRTVSIPSSGSVSFAVSTTNDAADEVDGSVTATVGSGAGYTVSTQAGSVSVVVSDDDPTPSVASCVSDDLVVLVSGYYDVNQNKAPGYGRNWRRVLIAFGEVQDSDLQPFSAAEALEGEQRWFGWRPVREALECLESNRPGVVPEVSIAAGAGVTEGGDASFTLTAAPKPASSLDVSVTVSQSGDFGVSTGVRTVTIPTGGSYTLTVATTDDGVVEVDGSVSVTVGSGTGYTVSSSSAAATVGVSDDDVPEVSIAAGAGVTEGGDASFTLTAAPKPASSLDVSVTVSQSGDFGVSTGVRTVSIPTGGSVSFAVSTTNDAADEVDGSVSVTVGSGAGYTVSTQAGSVSVVVSDDDPTPVVPVVSVVGGGGVTEGTDVSFTVSASPRPSSALSVQVSISQSGDFGVSTGVRTVTVPTTGSHTFTVSTTSDNVDEDDGSVSVTVNSGTGYTVSTQDGSATVTVSDDDDPTPQFDATLSVQDASGTEGGEIRFVVTLSQAVNHEVRVRWESGFGGDGALQAAHTEFWSMSGWLVFAPGETSQSAEVFLNEDSYAEADEVFQVELTSPQGATIADGLATLTIKDND